MTIENIVANLAAVFGVSVAIIIAIAGAAYGLFRIFGEKWLSGKFNERLEAFKHGQQKELEQLRYTINAVMDRTIKLHQREFEVLPEAWAKLADAYASVRSIVASLQTYPDLNRMGEPQLSEMLKATDLPTWKQDEIKVAGDKTKAYREELQWKRKNIARGESYNCTDYLRKNGIFIRPEMKARFIALAELIHMALIEHELNLEHPHHQTMREHALKLSKDGEKELKELEDLVQSRLWDFEKPELK